MVTACRRGRCIKKIAKIAGIAKIAIIWGSLDGWWRYQYLLRMELHPSQPGAAAVHDRGLFVLWLYLLLDVRAAGLFYDLWR